MKIFPYIKKLEKKAYDKTIAFMDYPYSQTIILYQIKS